MSCSTGFIYVWLLNPASFSATPWRKAAALRPCTLQTSKA
jgi:hypothetical protein